MDERWKPRPPDKHCTDDPFDYREAFIESFRLRGIHPDNVVSMADDSLRWQGVEAGAHAPVCTGLQFDLMNGQTPAMQST